MICYSCKKKDFLTGKEFKTIKYLETILTICNECWQKIVDRCHTCELPIYKNELIYEVSISRGAEYLISANEAEKKIQCYTCYYRWRREQERKKIIKWVLLIILISCVIGLLFLSLPLFNPKLVDNWKKTCLFKRRTLIALLFVIPIISVYLVIQEFSSRYKARERRT